MSFRRLHPLGPHQGFALDPQVSCGPQIPGLVDPPINKSWIHHCSDFTYCITQLVTSVAYHSALYPLESVLNRHIFLSLPFTVSFEAVLHVNTLSLSLLSASVVFSQTLSPSNEEICKHRFTTSATDARLLPLWSSVSFVTSSCRHHSLFVLSSHLLES